MTSLESLFDSNKAWAEAVSKKDPGFFKRLARQQKPKYFWIGCSDSRVPASQIVGLPPGEVFVHRNIANIVNHSDFNALSVLEFAVEILEVEHIIVCGHYGCGGVKAALDDKEHGLVDNWLEPIKAIRRKNEELLEDKGQVEKENFICELNVIEQVKNVYNTTIVQHALNQGKSLKVHGWIYSIDDGLLKDMQI
ncbi:MAG TPA: carbonate dehydratase [Trueperaceae bacterium]|nr:carbonate dehydratase [Trueperaceae bacterium]